MTAQRTTRTRSMSRRARPAELGGGSGPVLSAAEAAAAAPGDARPGLQIGGFVVIKIGDEEFTLEGRVGDHIIVEYHKPFHEALPLGTLPTMIGAVAKALGVPNADDFQKQLQSTLDGIGAVPVLGPVVKMLSEGILKITDLAINTQTRTYEFGFGVDTTATVRDIPIAAFGIKFTYTAPQPS